MFEDGKCPMLTSDVISMYDLSEDFVEQFCKAGCSVECGKFLQDTLKKKGIKPKDKLD